jgi:hypothetical protein
VDGSDLEEVYNTERPAGALPKYAKKTLSSTSALRHAPMVSLWNRQLAPNLYIDRAWYFGKTSKAEVYPVAFP